ncbi:MAG: hypothetical protein ACT4NY_02940 [Pseudonocardiales bacterium]
MTTAPKTATHPRATRPRHLKPRARKVWLTAHIASSVGWLGAAYTMLVLGTTALISDRTGFRVALYEVMHLFDRAVNIPLAAIMLITGLVGALGTPWRLVKHWWVLGKLILSVTALVVTPPLSVPRLIFMIETLPTGATTGSTAGQIVTISVCTVLTLTTVTTISVFKPWGHTRWAQRAAAARTRRYARR